MTGGIRDSYRLVRARAVVGAGWVALAVDASTRLALVPLGGGSYGAGPPAAQGGRWAVRGLIGVPDSIADGATHEVALVATDGQCWRGQGGFALFTHTDAAIVGAGDLGPC